MSAKSRYYIGQSPADPKLKAIYDRLRTGDPTIPIEQGLTLREASERLIGWLKMEDTLNQSKKQLKRPIKRFTAQQMELPLL